MHKIILKQTKSDIISAPLGIRGGENKLIKPMETRAPMGFFIKSAPLLILANSKCKRSKQHIQAPDITFFASKDSLIVIAALLKGASADRREEAIHIVATVYKIDLCNTTALLYDKNLTNKGITSINRSIRIGSTAFEQDITWLANIILHETIHADQFKYYQELGILTGKVLNNRQIKGLDEFEAYYINWRYRKELSLTNEQIHFLTYRMRLYAIDISDNEVLSLAKKGKMNKARTLLLSKI